MHGFDRYAHETLRPPRLDILLYETLRPSQRVDKYTHEPQFWINTLINLDVGSDEYTHEPEPRNPNADTGWNKMRR